MNRSLFCEPNSPLPIPDDFPARHSVLREFRWTGHPDGQEIIAPHWFFAAVCAVASAAPWIRRFRLRSLLIATTLIAVLFGIADLVLS